MFDITKFSDNFDNFSEDFWFISDFVVAAQWNQTGWNETYLTSDAGEVTLTFDGADIEGKPYSGAEFQSDHFYGYGSYEVEMMPSGESGVVSSFFLFTNTLFGADRHNEIDIEFLGGDTSVMNVNYFYGNEKLGDNGSVQIPLGFDAADALHVYRIDWQPDSIRWYADDALIYEIESGSGSVPIPDEAMKIYANIWTGGTGLEHWHGPIAPDASTQAVYSSVSYTPYTVTPSDAGGDAVSFAGHDQALIIDLAADTYAKAPRIMAIGDSLTEGWVHSGHPSDPPAERDGYRLDLWEHILANGGWTDYVGPLVTGPDTMPDRDHAGVGGKHLAAIVDDGNGPSDFSEALADEVPDIVLFMAGTNDFQNNGEDNFRNVDFPEIISGIAAAVSQFYAVTGSAEKYLVISTLPPKVKAGVPFEYANYLNKGYSIVDNQMVAGDANNGTYVKGLIATVTELQAQHPTLILFHNPVTTMEDISPDLIHFSNLGYQHYAEALFALLESEIGLTDGYLANIAETLAPAREAIGGEAGDRIGGDAQDNILRGRGGADFLEGRGGADTLEGGTGLDTFAYGLDALDGATDRITDYSAADGDVIDLGAIIDSFGWDASEIAANVTVSDVSGGAEVAIITPSGTFVLALVENVAASEIRLATTQFTENYTPLEELVGTSGNDSIYDGDRSMPIYGLAGDDNLNGAGGNDTLEGGPGLDRLTGGSGADVFRYKAADLDGRRDIIEDFSIAEGDKVDISQIGSFYGWSASELMDRLSFRDTSGGDLQLKINLPSGTVSFALIRNMDETSFLAANSLILEGGAPPDTGDDDGNMQLSAPDTTIDADENDAVIITLAGLDADATAVVTLSVNGSTVSQTTASNGNLVFDLSGLPDGQVTSSVTATDGGGNASTVSGPVLTLATAPDTSADVDGNLTVSAPDDYISDTEVSAVTFDVTGIDGDASAVVTVSDGSNSVSSTLLSGDGSVTLDLRSLADGSLTVSIEAQDGSGNTTGGTGTQITLDAGTDTTADLDGNLAVSAPDTQIDADERSAVTFIASGIDADAAAVISVSDGTATVTSAPLTGDGSVILDLSSLADGNLSLSITATDAAANSATAVGPTLILDSAPPPPANALVGTEGRETLEDGDGDGELYGLGDRDKLYGNGGNDTLEGGTGRDFLYGGSGADVFRYRASDLIGDRDNIEDFSIAEGDKVDLSEVASFYGWTAGELMDRLSFRDTSGGDLQLKIDLPSGTTSFALVRNMDANSFLTAGSIILDSGPPPGRLFLGSTGDDVLIGGAGNDLLEGDEGIDTLDGLAGSDTFIFARGALDGATDVINGFDASSEGDRVDISFLTTGYGWSEAEARSYTSLTEHAEGVYLSIDAPEFQSTLADFRGISAAGITFDDIVFV